jgi:hypothetical protein
LQVRIKKLKVAHFVGKVTIHYIVSPNVLDLDLWDQSVKMKIDRNQFVVNKTVAGEETLYFTSSGNETFLDENNNPRLEQDGPTVYAKAIKDKKSRQMNKDAPVGYSYFIKTEPNKKIYDPTVLHSVEPKVQKSFLNKTCKSTLVFTEVTQSIFNQYLSFLRTGNSLWLNQAQREIM